MEFKDYYKILGIVEDASEVLQVVLPRTHSTEAEAEGNSHPRARLED